MRERGQSTASAYLVALLSTGLALAARWALDPWLGEQLSLVTMFAAVAAAAWIGGVGPAIVAMVAGYLACDLLFIAPRGSITLDTAPALIGVAAYALSCALVMAAVRAVRSSRDQVREREQLLQITLASIGDAVVTSDAAGRVTFLNPVAERLTGWTLGDAEGQPIESVFRIVHETTRQSVRDPVRQVLSEGVMVGLANHTILLARDGAEHPIDDCAAPVRNEQGAVIGTALIFRDVSAAREAQRALRRSEDELRDFFDNAPVGLHWVDPDGTVLRVNQSELDMLGYRREEYVGRNLADFHADPQTLQDFLRRVSAGETLHDFPVRLRCRDGSIKHVSLSANAMLSEGRFIHARCFTRDVTRQKEVERTLRESEALFRTMGEAVPNFLWMADAQGRPIYRNPAWQRYVGLSQVELVLKDWDLLHHPEDRAAFREAWAASLASGEAFRFEVRKRRHDGVYRWFAARAVPLRDDMQRITRWIGTMTDIHDLKLAEDALRSADRRKDEFLAMLAHELRNPLAPLRNSLEILKRLEADAAMRTLAHATMERQVSQMERLIDDLMDISRITRNRLELRLQPVPLDSVIQHTLEASRPLAESARLQLDVRLPTEPALLHGDPVRLAQVFGNLLNNACKYTPAGGRIRLSADREGTDIVVTVQDTGIGIPAGMLPVIFDMFTQVDRTLERSKGGLGIGLTLVKQLVEKHGGSVEAHSEGRDQGSTFRVRLPLAPLATETPGPTLPAGAARRDAASRRVLVVDDNRDSADSMALLLRLSGHATRVCHDGVDELEAAEQFRPDVVLLDIGLSGLNGYDVCRRIREQAWGRELLVIALTGWGQDSDRRSSKAAGFDHHLLKPVDFNLLRSLLDSLPEPRPAC